MPSIFCEAHYRTQAAIRAAVDFGRVETDA
jgi:hypothetical protein